MNTKALLILLCMVLAVSIAWSEPMERTLEVTVVPGESFEHKHRFGIINKTLRPQIAVWAMDAEGNFITTIFVTKRGGTRKWIGGEDRPEALPVWYAAAGTEEKDAPDTVTGATPKRESEISWHPPGERKGSFVTIAAEVNSSFDYNDTYTEGNSGVNGQPSIVYSASLELDNLDRKVIMAPKGTGDVAGESGEVRTSLKGITSAARIVESIVIEWND